MPTTRTILPILLALVLIDGCSRENSVSTDDVTGSAPVAGNAEGDTRTIGFFHHDRITSGDDPTPRPPRHAASARSNESGMQLRTFFRTWAETGLPTIIDPFETLGTPPRPEEW